MTGESAAPITIDGTARDVAVSGAAFAARIDTLEADFSITRSGAAPTVAGYRDLSTIALVEYRAGTEHGVAQIASAVWPGGATETEEQEPP